MNHSRIYTLALNTVEILRKKSPLLTGKSVELQTILLGILIAILVFVVIFVRMRIAKEIRKRNLTDAPRRKKNGRR